MDEPQSTAAPVPGSTPLPGIFGTKIPSSVAFGTAILLFFMPFINIRCNNMNLQSVSGVQLATGFKIKGPGTNNSPVGSFEQIDTVSSGKGERNEPNIFALVALGLGIVGLVLLLLDRKGGITGGVITGILAALALVAMMIDVKRKVKMEMPQIGDKARRAATDFEKLGDSMYIAVDFTAWLYIAVIAFAAGAFFCYRRMQASKFL